MMLIENYIIYVYDLSYNNVIAVDSTLPSPKVSSSWVEPVVSNPSLSACRAQAPKLEPRVDYCSVDNVSRYLLMPKQLPRKPKSKTKMSEPIGHIQQQVAILSGSQTEIPGWTGLHRAFSRRNGGAFLFRPITAACSLWLSLLVLRIIYIFIFHTNCSINSPLFMVIAGPRRANIAPGCNPRIKWAPHLLFPGFPSHKVEAGLK